MCMSVCVCVFVQMCALLITQWGEYLAYFFYDLTIQQKWKESFYWNGSFKVLHNELDPHFELCL